MFSETHNLIEYQELYVTQQNNTSAVFQNISHAFNAFNGPLYAELPLF